MQIEQFERLWPQRQSLPQEQRSELEELARSNVEFKSFVSEGALASELVRELDTEKPAENFTYRMGLYARNNPEERPSLFESGSVRWGSLSAGVVLGVMLVAFALSPGYLTTGADVQTATGSIATTSDLSSAGDSKDIDNILPTNEVNANLAESADSTDENSEEKDIPAALLDPMTVSARSR